jgi:hypothetical protein
MATSTRCSTVSRRPLVDRRLNGIDDQCDRFDPLDGGHDSRERLLGEHEQPLALYADSARAQLDLPLGLLARDVENIAAERRQRVRQLEQQRRLADSRLAAKQDDAARQEAAAEKAVEFVDPRRQPLCGSEIDLIDRAQFLPEPRRRLGRCVLRAACLDQGVPLAATRASAEPLDGSVATLRADEGHPSRRAGTPSRRLRRPR